MPSIAKLLDQYSESHQNPLNQKIHKVCVPLIEWSVLGILWAMPRPEFFGNLTWAHLIVGLALIYYAQFKNFKVIAATFILMLPFWIYISFHPLHIMQTSLVVFIVAWIGQFYGHKIEGKKPSFFQDLFFLLIGPLWVAEAFLRPRGRSLSL